LLLYAYGTFLYVTFQYVIYLYFLLRKIENTFQT